MLGNFSCFCCCLLTFFKIHFFKKYFVNTFKVSIDLGLDQDLGQNCLQRPSADDKSQLVRKWLKAETSFFQNHMGQYMRFYMGVSFQDYS